MSTAELPATDHLSDDAKRRLLARLARELMSRSGATVSVTDAAGEVVVYTIPADARARAERAMREATPEQRAELDRRSTSLDKTFTLEQAKQLGAQAGQPPQ
jgi:hypothetical protein